MEGGSCDLCKYMYLASRETASAFICICKWAVMNAGTAHSWPVTWTDDDLTRYRQKNREIKEISADVRQTACGSVRTVRFVGVCVCPVHTSSCIHIKRVPSPASSHCGLCLCLSPTLLIWAYGSHNSSTNQTPHRLSSDHNRHKSVFCSNVLLC